ncbi:hypothetical protein V8C34DRAFT_296464 [Trichoderma compactum]
MRRFDYKYSQSASRETMGSDVKPLGFNVIPYQDPGDSKPSQENANNSPIKDDVVKPSGHKPLEFVSVTPAKQKGNKAISTLVRTQVMKDYFWKQRNPDSTDQAASENPINPSQYKGRFRLNSRPSKTKPKAGVKKAKGHERTTNEVARAQKGGIPVPRGPISDPSVYDPDGFFASTPAGLLGGSLDPFDSFSLKLKPESLKLIYYYKQSYSKDFLSLNVGGGYCLFDAREHRALFHSILYLVALDFNLRRGFSDAFGCLYHSSEAFRLINEQIQSATFEDATIAAVALIGAKENLAGMFDVSYMHMQGLKYMIQKRGGIQNIKGLHRGVVIWADFCNSSVWNCSPQFPHTSLSSTHDIEFPSQTSSSTDDLSQDNHHVESQIVSLMQSLREISAVKDVQGHKKTEASRVYDTEYRLHLVKASIADRGSSSSELVPLCVALYLYLYLAIRELPARAQMIERLIDRLQATFNLQLIEKPAPNTHKQSWILWMLFIGYAAALENKRQEWFAQSLKLLFAKSNFRGMDQLQETLKSVLWQDSWSEHYFKKLKEIA